MHFQTVYKLFVGKPVTYKANTKAFEFFLNILLANLNNAIVSKYAAQGKYRFRKLIPQCGFIHEEVK